MFQDSVDFQNLISFGIASRSLSATTCCGGKGSGADLGLKIHFEYFCWQKASSYLSIYDKFFLSAITGRSKRAREASV